MVLLVFTTCLVAMPALASDITPRTHIGGLRNVEGRVMMERRGREIFARTGMRVFTGDIILTGPEGTLALVLKDETSITIGPGSRVALDDYAYDPQKQDYGMSTRVLQGSALFVTGALAKVAPESIAVRTPVSTIGIRGTRFLVEVK